MNIHFLPRIGVALAATLMAWTSCASGSAHRQPAAPPPVAAPLPAPGPAPAPAPEPDRIRFSFTDTTQDPGPTGLSYLTFIGRDSSGRSCHLDGQGRFLPCTAADNRPGPDGRDRCDYALPFRGSYQVDLPRTLRIDSGRAYLSLGQPLALRVDPVSGGLVQPDPFNPADPNRQLIFDWIEFTLDGTGFHGNTTCVDQFGMPVSLAVVDRARPNQPLGPVGIVASRAALFRAWRDTVPVAFRGLEDPDALRIVAPSHAPVGAESGLQHHFQAYLDQQWQRYRNEPLHLTPDEGDFLGRVQADGRMLFTRAGDAASYGIAAQPSSSEVFRCDGVLAQGNGLERVLGAQIAALINRHLLDQPLAWRSADRYYQEQPDNAYARFWHQHSLGGKAYGFPYDDVNDQSSYLVSSTPEEVQVSFRRD